MKNHKYIFSFPEERQFGGMGVEPDIPALFFARLLSAGRPWAFHLENGNTTNYSCVCRDRLNKLKHSRDSLALTVSVSTQASKVLFPVL
jgi:hypothetical protein